jgi:hypothetical protein
MAVGHGLKNSVFSVFSVVRKVLLGVDILGKATRRLEKQIVGIGRLSWARRAGKYFLYQQARRRAALPRRL